MNLVLISLIIFFFNIPFGYWRANVKRFSLQWALSIHLPIPIVILLRIYGGIGFALYTYPILVGAFFGGQFIGKLIFDSFKKNRPFNPTSCLVMDVKRNIL